MLTAGYLFPTRGPGNFIRITPVGFFFNLALFLIYIKETSLSQISVSFALELNIEIGKCYEILQNFWKIFKGKTGWIISALPRQNVLKHIKQQFSICSPLPPRLWWIPILFPYIVTNNYKFNYRVL